MTTNYQCVAGCFNNGIAVLTAIIHGITFFDYYRSQARAISERTLSNTRYAVRDGDRSQTRATLERPLSNTRHAVRDSDGSKTSAILERIISNTRYAVGDAIVGNGFGDSDRARVF